MSDIINLLPDSVANQIAAGEVIQRPASVVKELVENSVDAGSTSIIVNVKEAGKNLIQISDNGSGMSETDARMAFERHATSKIKNANDLFAIRTMGFRGEALASIAAIANVELKTKKKENDLGVAINISGSEVVSQEPVSCSDGSNFLIKNLFFNVPARRKFLKKNSTELKHIITEFQRIALVHPEIAMTLQHNDTEIYNLPISNLHKRITNIFGKGIKQNLISIETDTTVISIKGFIGKPEFAKKTGGEQYFFINNRYMKHPYFYKAVLLAYENILPSDTVPSFFLYFDADPSTIDINIHPTKTEIKFEDDRAIWQIIQASVKQSLGKFNIVPSIDFDQESILDIDYSTKNKEIRQPSIEINHSYNPFEEEQKPRSNSSSGYSRKEEKSKSMNWESLYSGFENEKFTSAIHQEEVQTTIEPEKTEEFNSGAKSLIQLKNRYILSPVKSGIMLIDQKRAHERILFEKYTISLSNKVGIAQTNLFPQTIELNPSDFSLLQEIIDDIRTLGFDISEFSNNTIVVNGTPADIENPNIKEIIEEFLENYKEKSIDIKLEAKEKLALSLAKASSIKRGQKLSTMEMNDIIDNLFACTTPNYTADGKTIISIINTEEIEKKFK